MTKTNPLFVDSTKIRGDRIGTQVELNKVILYDGEKLFVTILAEQGQPVHTPMEAMDEHSFGACILLKHLEKFSYQFVIEENERRVFQSGILHGRAEHAVVATWEPATEEVVPLLEVKREVAATPAPPSRPAWISNAARAAESLVEKFDL